MSTLLAIIGGAVLLYLVILGGWALWRSWGSGCSFPMCDCDLAVGGPRCLKPREPRQ